MTPDNWGYIVSPMKESELNTLAVRVRFARAKLRLTQAALAEKVGLSQPMIRKIEAGSETAKVVELAVALEVRPEWLATGTGPVANADTAADESGDALEAALCRLAKAVKGLTAAQIEHLAAAVEARMPDEPLEANSQQAAPAAIFRTTQ
ncbi:helix-turn-helix domain-containing protein [Trinickia sp. YCB016]